MNKFNPFNTILVVQYYDVNTGEIYITKFFPNSSGLFQCSSFIESIDSDPDLNIYCIYTKEV